MTKPFDLRELLARITAILRRTDHQPGQAHFDSGVAAAAPAPAHRYLVFARWTLDTAASQACELGKARTWR